MKGWRRILLTVAVGASVATVAMTHVETTWGQQVVYTPPTPTIAPASVHYHRVYQGTFWHWTPEVGWHTHDHFTYVPHWGMTYYTARPIQPPVIYRNW